MRDEQSSGTLLTESEFTTIRELVYDRFGINLTDQKRNLVVGRLLKVLRSRRIDTFAAYLDFLKSDTTGEGLSELIDHISTNHTFFFREPEHFRFLSEQILPGLREKLAQRHERDIRIWSAGCSSGEEPYSIAITLRQFFGQTYGDWKAGVLATDISSHVLRHAERAIYPVERLAKTPADLRARYFTPLDGERVQVAADIAKDVTFRRLNFMSPAFPFKKPFQLIFCRNVMIYFDAPTRQRLVQKFHDVLEPGGYLFIGHSETLGREDSHFEYVQPAIYRRKS
ncbi:MAG TPA: chemotaxis protein CheR [Verrucomicrobia bacterium]|nr:chemotaxis protein CheR [Verrucomicrobiota bacterium]